MRTQVERIGPKTPPREIKLIPFEALSSDVVTKITGAYMPLRGHHKKQYRETDYRDLFSNDAMEVFHKWFWRDIERLGYDFLKGPVVPPLWWQARS